MLAEFFVQQTHLRKMLAGFLVVLATSPRNQSFSLLLIEFNCLK